MIYRNIDKESIYRTNENSLPPYSTSHFIVKETQNSSCRLLRPSSYKVAIDKNFYDNTSLVFGLYTQPFAEFNLNESEIPKVKIQEQLFRCKQCSCYLNNKFKIIYNAKGNICAKCNICDYENDPDESKCKVKDEYFYSDSSKIIELNSPSVDYVASQTKNNEENFFPHYLIMIDASQASFDNGFPFNVKFENFKLGA